jgi:RecA-family ATPase
VSDPDTWGTFDEAVQAGRKHIGCMLNGSGYAVIDLDRPASPDQEARHTKILEAFGSTYVERSTSGAGYHIWMKGTFDGSGRRRDNVEVYCRGRYMICTGDVVNPAPITEQQVLLSQLVGGMASDLPVGDEQPPYPAEYVLEQVRSRLANFDALVECQGDLPRLKALGYDSQSDADFALAVPLARFSADYRQWREFFLSVLGTTVDRKGSPKSQEDYLRRTYEKARVASEQERRAMEHGRWLADGLLKADRATKRPNLKLQQISSDHVREPPAERFAVGSLFPFGKASVLYAPQGAGKSALLAQLAFIFAGHDGFGTLLSMPIREGGPVLVYTAEDSFDDWERKAAAFREAFGIEVVARALCNLYVADKTEGIARLSEVVQLRAGDKDSFILRREPRRTPEWHALRDAALAVGARLIIVETTSRLIDDEDNAGMAAFIGAGGHLAAETGAAVVVSHHPTKAASRSNDSSPESARGGGALINNSRTAVSLFPAQVEVAARWSAFFSPEHVLVLEHTKSTSSVPRQPPIVVVRCPTRYGAVLKLPDEAIRDVSPSALASRRDDEARQIAEKVERLQRLHDVATRLKAFGPLSANKLVEHRDELGVAKHKVGHLVEEGIAEGVLEVVRRDSSGRILDMKVGPRPKLAEESCSSNP